MPYHPVFNVPRFALREPRPVLPLHRGDAIRSSICEATRGVPRDAQPARGDRRCGRRRCAASRRRDACVDGSPCRWLRCSSPARAARTCTTSRSTSRCGESTFFADGALGAAARRGHRRARPAARRRAALHRQGRTARTPTVFPFPVDATVLARGQERFNIYCSPCHGRTGSGDGMIVRRGYRRPPSFHDDRLRERAGRPLLRRDHQRLRRDARLRRADRGRRSLGDRRLHPRAAAERARDARRRAGRPNAEQTRSDARSTQTADVAIPELARPAAAAADRRRRRRASLSLVGCVHRTRRSSSSRT